MSFGDAVAAIIQYIVHLNRSHALTAEDGGPIEARKLASAIAVHRQMTRRGAGRAGTEGVRRVGGHSTEATLRVEGVRLRGHWRRAA